MDRGSGNGAGAEAENPAGRGLEGSRWRCQARRRRSDEGRRRRNAAATTERRTDSRVADVAAGSPAPAAVVEVGACLENVDSADVARRVAGELARADRSGRGSVRQRVHAAGTHVKRYAGARVPGDSGPI